MRKNFGKLPLGAIHKGRLAKIEVFRPPLPRLSGVVRKLIPPPLPDVRLFDLVSNDNYHKCMHMSSNT